VDERARRRWLAAARWLATGAAVAGIVRFVDLRQVGARLERFDWRWGAAFVALTVPQYLVYAARWRFTASRLGVALRFRRALADYYLSTLLNQILPFGIAGDLVRIARHREGPAARAIVLERFSGMCGLAPFLVASAIFWLVRGRGEFVPVALAVLGGIAVALALAPRLGRRWNVGGEVRAALWERGALPVQLALSMTAVAILCGLFALAARSVGASLDLRAAIEVVPLVLAATTLPWAFGGWGAREAATAALYRLLGFDAATGVAVSVSFGLLSLVAAAPGLVVLALPSERARRA
jgi:uncharacterized membrane protein YbhN (UPF0104 family)